VYGTRGKTGNAGTPRAAVMTVPVSLHRRNGKHQACADDDSNHGEFRFHPDLQNHIPISLGKRRTASSRSNEITAINNALASP
jgi:hypothetical protein